MSKIWLMLIVSISLGDSDKNPPSHLVSFWGETFGTEAACLEAAKEPGWKPTNHQIIAFCVEGSALLISPKQYTKGK